MKKNLTGLISILIIIVIFSVGVFSQTTEFTYQGSLQNSGTAASGSFDFELLLFDALSGGTQIGSTLTRSGVAVANGIFSVKLDFGSNYPGANRFLEIHVVQTGGGAFTPLTPRQAVSSAPYSVKSLNADTATNATNAVNAANATNAVNFSGALSGDVTGSQGSTTVARLQGNNLVNTAPLNGQVLKFNTAANQWEPGTDNTSSGGGGVTSVTASGPLASSGGATPNISLTGVVPTVNGGTGLSAPGAAGNLLRSNGAAWTSAPLQATDVPTGSTNYIQNATSPQAASNFNISGNGIVGGNVGIGVPNPQAKLDVNGTAQIASGGSGGQVVFAAPNGESGMLISGTSRADIRFDGSTLKLLAGVSTGAPISTNGIAIATSGNVGIGTTNPTTKLYVLNSVAGTSAISGESASGPGVYGKSTSSRGVFGESTSGRGVFGQSTGGEGVLGVSTSSAGVSGGSTSGSGVYGESAVVNSLAAAGVYGKATGSGGIGVIGESNVANAVGVFGVSTSPAGVAVYARNNSGGRAIVAEGNVAQSLSSNGLIKAMINVASTGVIFSCYNGVTNSSSGNCGFIITRPLGDVGIYRINFNFPITGRFISVTAEYGSNCFQNPCSNNHGANYRGFDSTSMEVFTFYSDSKDTASHTFMLIMY